VGDKVLRDVSRSFYLSIRPLPPGMRETASLGYLLARASDTIADTEGLPARVRLDLLERFRTQILTGESEGRPFEQLILEIQEDLLPTIAHKGERRLIESLDDCLRWLDATDDTSRDSLHRVLDSITEGQMLDLNRFGLATAEEPAFLQTAKELTQYADLVAGSVGRFWTEIGTATLPDYAGDSTETMIRWGQSYGRGLQWLNIIRDIGEDLRMGRCYLPYEELLEAGWREGGTWVQNQAAIMEVGDHWMDQIEVGLRDGMQYALSLRSRRLKLASVLPALIDARIRKSQSGYISKRVKISRAELRRIATRTFAQVMCKRPLDRYYQQLLYA